jgi:hypothetical protein
LDENNTLVTTVLANQSLALNPNESRILNYTWNTGQTLSGGYGVYCQFSEAGNVISRAQVSITIAPVRTIASRVAADRISYTANQDVTVTSTITSLSPNYIFSNLEARLRIINNQNTILLTGSRTVPILTPTQITTLKTYWNTSTHPQGIYTVTLEILEGLTLLNTSISSFEILGSQDTGEGLRGNITAQPNPVYQGRDETVTYTVTNSGNEDIAGLKLKVLILDPETQEVKQILEDTKNIAMGDTFAAESVLSTSDFAPRTYVAILQVTLATFKQPTTLASAAFEVKSTLEADKTIPDLRNLLVWVNEKCRESDRSQAHCKDDDPECIRLDLLEKIISEAADSYLIVDDRKDLEKVKATYYTDLLILGDRNPLTDHHGDELRELVHSGKGLISSLYLKHGECHEDESLFGLEYRGHLPGFEHDVRFLDSLISDEMTLKATGRSIRVEVDDPNRVVAWMNGFTGLHCDPEPGPYPGAVLNPYGLGTTTFFAFDLGLTLSDETYDQISTLLKKTVTYVHRPLDTTAFHPAQMIPIEIEIKSPGSAMDVRIKETYPPEIKLYDPLAGEWITENPWTMDIPLDPDKTETILYYALTPDQAGTYTLQTEVGYLDHGDYSPHETLATEIVVQKDSVTMLDDILDALRTLSVTKHDESELNDAIKHMEKIENRVLKKPGDIKKNIDDLLEAVDALLDISSADISEIRLMMDRLLLVWVGKLALLLSP